MSGKGSDHSVGTEFYLGKVRELWGQSSDGCTAEQIYLILLKLAIKQHH